MVTMHADLTELAAAAGIFPDPFRLLIRERAGSTNDEARDLALAGAPAGLVVLALEQTQGRGRRGNRWFAPPAESLAFSVVLRPEAPRSLWPRLALAAGLAVAEAAGHFGVEAGIKWPNDIWIRDRKAAGILVEAGEDFVIVGIGINVNAESFPPDVAATATSLHREAGAPVARDALLTAVIRRLAVRHPQIGMDFDELLAGVRRRCVLSGRAVSLLTARGLRHGIVEGIGPGGELLLRTPEGLETHLQADEVRLVDEAREGRMVSEAGW